MTGLAGGRDTKCNVIGIYGLVIIGLVTTHAGVGGIVVISSFVAAVAIHGGMGS